MRELSSEDHDRMDDLTLKVRREKVFKRQVELVNQIAAILGYPKVNPRGKWARQLVDFICEGTDEESTWAGSWLKQRMEADSKPRKNRKAGGTT